MLFLTIITLTLVLTSAKKEESESKEESSEEETKVEATVEDIQLPPHIIFILADDLGWNDVSFHGSPQIPTPNIDALAASAIILNNYYTEAQCTPARAALMTGKYPIHLGLQHSVIKTGEPTGLPFDTMIMPEYFKTLGYVNYMVGKWHLGYAKRDYLPTSRGFDSFFGIYTEQIDYYDYTNFERTDDPALPPFYGIDLHDGIDIVKNKRGSYATDVFTKKALDIIATHNASAPLFLYMAHLASHVGNEYMPLQAPQSSIAQNAHILDIQRRKYAGMVSSLDDSVGRLIDGLNQRGFLENSIIVFTSDNGGNQNGKGSNWPLRGQKQSSWEGSLRVPSILWSPLLRLKEPRTSNQLMHISDWLPTLFSAIGGDTNDLGALDGINLWKALVYNQPSPRIELLHNIDPIDGTAALRRGDYKLIIGSTRDASNTWLGPTGLEDMEAPPSLDEWIGLNSSIVARTLQETRFWVAPSSDTWRINAIVSCNQPSPDDDGGCNPQETPCLFNIASDPCEYNNLALRYPRVVRSMLEIISSYNSTAVPPLSTSRDPTADPRCHNFAHVPWLEDDFVAECPFS